MNVPPLDWREEEVNVFEKRRGVGKQPGFMSALAAMRALNRKDETSHRGRRV